MKLFSRLLFTINKKKSSICLSVMIILRDETDRDLEGIYKAQQ